MKVIIVLCDPIKRLKSDFVHTTKTTEPHANQMRKYTRIEDYLRQYVPLVKKRIYEDPNYLTDIYYHDIASSIITNGYDSSSS